MADSQHLTGETYDHKVAAVFATEQEAQAVGDFLRQKTDLNDNQVLVMTTSDQHQGRELEPESRGIWKTLVRSHIWLAVVGALAGLLLFIVTYATGVAFVVSNAVWSAALFVIFCSILGMMVAGAVTLRPDHTPYIMKAQAALKEGKAVLTVHASSHAQMVAARELLEQQNADIITSL